MIILEVITQKASKLGLKFLVIGGHAVGAHGYVRHTGDLDLLVQGAKRAQWKELLISCQYIMVHEHPVFMQFKYKEIAGFPVDLMFVEDSTFEGLWKESVEVKIAGISGRVPSVNHLIALKLHALKEGRIHRRDKDKGDIIGLVKAAGIKVSSQEFRQLCEKYGSIELYESIKKEIQERVREEAKYSSSG